MQTLFPYVGGKARQAPVDLRPTSMRLSIKAYIEAPAAATAAVFFAKKRLSKIEILNDLDQRFPLLFRALRDNLDERGRVLLA